MVSRTFRSGILIGLEAIIGAFILLLVAMLIVGLSAYMGYFLVYLILVGIYLVYLYLPLSV